MFDIYRDGVCLGSLAPIGTGIIARDAAGMPVGQLATLLPLSCAYCERPVNAPSAWAVRIVAEIPKSARESVRVIPREKAGQLGADLRIASTTGRGTMKETAKGIRILAARLGEAIDGPAPIQPSRWLKGVHRRTVRVMPPELADWLPL